MNCERDPRKAKANFRKHEVRFTEAVPVFEDDFTVTDTDDESDPHEVRYLSIGMGMKGRVLLVAYCYRGRKICIICARPAEAHERRQYEEHR